MAELNKQLVEKLSKLTADQQAQLALAPQGMFNDLLSGRVVFFGEIRKGAAVEFSGKGGKVFHQSKIAVETGDGFITVTEFLADTVDWKTWKSPYPKGTVVYGVCRGLEEASGAQVATAKLLTN